ncbi:hypothetical protein ACIRBX_19605 [Kitasatospora sp. NPDC096147]|uniref:hypothetical protein n=1 Tax=Kitasatospora sp. NPDC096147 TaxID=3364093 RepID=UPI0037F6E380
MAVRRYWYVLALFGVLIGCSLPLYRVRVAGCRQVVPDGFCAGVAFRAPGGLLGPHELARPGWLAVYWAVAGLLACWLVLRRYRRAGRPVRVLPAVVGMVLAGGAAAVLTVIGWQGIRHPSAWAASAHLLVFNGATPLLVGAVALLLLAVGERSWVLLLFALGFAAIGYGCATYDPLYLAERLGWVVELPEGMVEFRPAVHLAIPAVVLLLGALAAGLTGRFTRGTGGRHAREEE